ncbi:nickel pincer cofactor biosynthesis protein LarB [Geomonas nitrogeniifigens]|uniref:Nickel pincer cofactor biosynthesis protein LarB n=1 Tax=Geomonas diazotrophica TaxID=2843197 RepID=A0ABX8JG37_9BACT|nr:nickel pincer cofactor biosynthesis protein LarB [Geomonas nitrogeniifigens]QWV96951.1 nickel pincer cofactor biosynthesis protein LarB [Geomonas nitrogeniifigens]QXE86128.1 nickel pincer cofactor biosynthesis protein LarB [Geomonas nitrogeniifigens]
MQNKVIEKVLQEVSEGALDVAQALQRLKHLPFEDLGCATVDHHRTLRQGFPEVIFGQGKSISQMRAIITALIEKGGNVLATRVNGAKGAKLKEFFPQAVYHPDARALTIEQHPVELRGRGKVLVVCAGTSDIPVAAEAVLTAQLMGNEVEKVYDVGVAGLHRLLARRGALAEAAVIIVVAGMEGALPSVVGGLVDKPVIAVPTSVGYGASFGGVAALLGMLNSCAAGVTVVNIDNGFGAAYAASLMNRIHG